MTHDQVVDEIIRRAHRAGVLSHYCRASQRCLGSRGIPDLYLVGMYHAGHIEVKTDACSTLSPAQTTWRHALMAAGVLYEVMFERDLEAGGAVDMFLGFLTTGSAVAA